MQSLDLSKGLPIKILAEMRLLDPDEELTKSRMLQELDEAISNLHIEGWKISVTAIRIKE